MRGADVGNGVRFFIPRRHGKSGDVENRKELQKNQRETLVTWGEVGYNGTYERRNASGAARSGKSIPVSPASLEKEIES